MAKRSTQQNPPSNTSLDADVAVSSPVVSGSSPHTLERQVQHQLLSAPHLKFSSLVIRRIADGVCLEGVLESNDGSDVCNLAQQVQGVERVLNHLVISNPRE